MNLMWQTLSHLFTPHRSNNHRARILQPSGLVLLAALVLLVHSSVEIAKVAPLPQGYVLGYASNISKDQVIAKINLERAAVGLAPLTENGLLSQAAEAKARHMFTNDYWAHVAPDGTTPWSFIKGVGYRYSVAGENLARDFDDTDSMVAAWMNSPTHKDNIVHSRYQETGVAVVNGTLGGVETTLVVHMFGLPTQTMAAVSPSAPPPDEQTPIQTTVPQTAAEPVTEPIQVVAGDSSGDSIRLSATPEVQLISPLAIKRSLILAVIGLVAGVIVLDEIMIYTSKRVRFVGRNIAHLGLLLALAGMVTLALQPGGIL